MRMINGSKLLAAVILMTLFAASGFAQSRVGTVDLGKVFDSYWRQKQATTALRELVAELQKDADALKDGLKKSGAAYEKLRDEAGDPAVSEEEREKRRKVVADKLKELKDAEETLRQYNIQAQTRISEQRRRVRDKIMEDIRTAVNAKAKAGNFAVVIDISAKSANSTLDLVTMIINRQDPTEEYIKSTPVVLYSSPETDLTTAVIEQLNAGAPIESTGAAQKKDETKDEKKK